VYMPFFTLSRQTMAVARSVMRWIPSRHHLIPVRSQHWILTVSVGTRNRMTLATCLADHLELTSKGSHIDLPLHRIRFCLIKWAIQVTQTAGSTASQIHLGHSPKQILSNGPNPPPRRHLRHDVGVASTAQGVPDVPTKTSVPH